jgi:hypothetical protein
VLNKTLATMLLSVSFGIFSDNQDFLTQTIRDEFNSHTNTNITVDTHPTLYSMVKRLTEKSGVPMPRYISIHNSAYTRLTRNGIAVQERAKICAYMSLLGDLCIYQELLTDLSYNDIEGCLALAIAEGYSKKPLKLAKAGLGTFGATIASIWYLNKAYNLRIGSFLDEALLQGPACNRNDNLEAIMFLLFLPTAVATKLYANHLQKQVDLDAVKIVDKEKVVQAINNIKRINDNYKKEDFAYRIISALKLREIFDTVFYPIRSYTDEERVGYLRREA